MPRWEYTSDWERFKSKVVEDKGGCWLWQPPLAKGYAVFRAAGKKYQARRYAWEQVVGPLDNESYLYTGCGNEGCVNPYHAIKGSIYHHAPRRKGWQPGQAA